MSLRRLHRLWPAVGLCACFSPLTDRDCADDTDCFAGERCETGRCLTVVSQRTDAGPTTLEVEVYVFGREGDLAAATVEHEPAADADCHCPSSSATPCVLDLPGAETATVCAYAAGHQPCAVTLDEETARVELYLAPCTEGEACPDAPTACGCDGLPLCGA